MRPRRVRLLADAVVCLFVLLIWLPVPTKDPGAAGRAWAAGGPPTPVLERGHAVALWFVFKFNVKTFPGCRVENQGKESVHSGGKCRAIALANSTFSLVVRLQSFNRAMAASA